MPSQRGPRVGSLPTYGTRFVHVIVQFDEVHNKALMLTCPREDCRKQFILLDDPGQTRTATCPYCAGNSNHV